MINENNISIYPYINGRGVNLDADGKLVLNPNKISSLEERFIDTKIIDFWKNSTSDFTRVSIVITDMNYPMYVKTVSLSCDDISCISFWRQGLIIYDVFPFLERTVLINNGYIRYKDYIHFNIKDNKTILNSERVSKNKNAQMILNTIDMRKIYKEKYFLGVTDGIIEYENIDNFFISYRFYHNKNPLVELKQHNLDFVNNFKIFSRKIAIDRINSLHPMEFKCENLLTLKYCEPKILNN
jgi:hypothetical protein